TIVEVAEDRVTWRRGGERLGAMTVDDLVACVSAADHVPRVAPLYPRQVRAMVGRRGGPGVGGGVEGPPGPADVRWIAPSSRHPFGPGATYENRCLSFPWIVVLIVFADGELINWQQAFFRTAPIQSLDDPLCFTNLLNVAQAYDQESWLCLANLH